MSDNPVKEVVTDLLQHLETLETRCAALVQLLKEKHVGTEEDLARCMQQASEASSIKWGAARLRMEHLFASVPEPSEKSSGAQEGQAETKPQDQSKKHSDEAAEKGRKQARTLGSPDNENVEQPQQLKASERDSKRSGAKEPASKREPSSEPSESAISQSSENPPQENRAEENGATRTESTEAKDERDQQGGEKAA